MGPRDHLNRHGSAPERRRRARRYGVRTGRSAARFEEVIPTAEQFDLVVVGGGPGGYAAALYAASAGVNVALVEKDRLGGTCLNRGCIPAKAFLETAAVNRHVTHAADFGIVTSTPSVEFAVTQARKRKIVDGLVGGIAAMCKARKVQVYAGTGSLGPDKTVTVTGNDGERVEIRGEHVILASGSVPRLIPNFERGGPIMTSDEVLDLDHVPGRVVVIGGGAIGCEFASTFADLGAQVTILEGLPKILPGLDADVANVVVRSFKRKQIDIRTGVMVTGHTPRDDGGTTVHFGDDEHLEVDAVVVSVGRRPYADELGLDRTGVVVDARGFVEVDEFCRTAEPGVFAIGDLINTPQLAHVGYAEAILVVKQTLGDTALPIQYDRVPWAIYCHPEVAFAGPDEAAGQGAGLRRRRRQAPVQVQLAGADPGRDRGAVQGHRRAWTPTAAPGASSASTWWARGSPSSSAAAIWPSTGRRRWTRWPSSSSPTPASASCSVRP